jgi:hypothetical protein
MHHTVANYEQIQVIAHEAAICVLWGADYRLTTHIEAGVDKHGASAQLFEAFEQPVEHWIGVGVHGLNAS